MIAKPGTCCGNPALWPCCANGKLFAAHSPPLNLVYKQLVGVTIAVAARVLVARYGCVNPSLRLIGCMLDRFSRLGLQARSRFCGVPTFDNAGRDRPAPNAPWPRNSKLQISPPTLDHNAKPHVWSGCGRKSGRILLWFQHTSWMPVSVPGASSRVTNSESVGLQFLSRHPSSKILTKVR